MDRSRQTNGAAFRTATLLLCAAVALPGHAQTEPDPDTSPLDALRAEVTATQALNDPKNPIWLRFALHNTSDKPVEIPLGQPVGTDGGIVLPTELIKGTPEQPALFVAYAEEKLAPIDCRLAGREERPDPSARG